MKKVVRFLVLILFFGLIAYGNEGRAEQSIESSQEEREQFCKHACNARTCQYNEIYKACMSRCKTDEMKPCQESNCRKVCTKEGCLNPSTYSYCRLNCKDYTIGDCLEVGKGVESGSIKSIPSEKRPPSLGKYDEIFNSSMPANERKYICHYVCNEHCVYKFYSLCMNNCPREETNLCKKRYCEKCTKETCRYANIYEDCRSKCKDQKIEGCLEVGRNIE